MKKTLLTLIILLPFFTFKNLTAQKLSSNAEISILTCAPGNDLYSVFGHSAIRIKDPALRIDKVYNYGTFNFETPNFYLKFVRGQLDYMLSTAPYRYFIIPYINEDRQIKEQVLNLSVNQKDEIFSFLENNALPENMYYRYDFFYDNCATRVKDVIKNVLKEDLILPNRITKNKETFRHLIHKYLKGKNWERYGINLALGQPTDKIVTAEEATFLPDYLEFSLKNAKIKNSGKEKPLVKQTRFIYEAKNSIKKIKQSILRPLNIFSVLLFIILLLTFFEFKKKKYYLILDKTLFFIVGIIGIILLTLWFGTEHSTVINNWNLLWAMPLFLFAAFKLKDKNNKSGIKIFFLIMSIIMLLSIFADVLILHLYDYASIPVVLFLSLRAFLIYKLR